MIGRKARNTGHKAIRARAVTDFAHYIGWEKLHGVLYMGVLDMAVGPLPIIPSTMPPRMVPPASRPVTLQSTVSAHALGQVGRMRHDVVPADGRLLNTSPVRAGQFGGLIG